MLRNPFLPFERWLEWLDSHDGRLSRRKDGGDETEFDIAALLPTPPTQTIFTVGDLRDLVEAGREWRAMKRKGEVKS